MKKAKETPKERLFGQISLNYLRPCNQRDFPNKGDVYIHHWGTGYQLLVFYNDKEAQNWWDMEMKRIKEKIAA